jgi:hypothetical protein
VLIDEVRGGDIVLIHNGIKTVPGIVVEPGDPGQWHVTRFNNNGTTSHVMATVYPNEQQAMGDSGLNSSGSLSVAWPRPSGNLTLVKMVRAYLDEIQQAANVTINNMQQEWTQP